MHSDGSNPGLRMDEAAQALRAGQVERAEAALAPLLETPAPHSEALHLMGVVRHRQNRVAEAAALLARSVAARPEQPSAQFWLARALSDMGQFEESLAPYRAALRLKPELAAAQFGLANALHKLQRLDQAEPAFRALLRLAPTLVPAKLALGTVLTELGRLVEAEALLREGMAQASDPPLKLEFKIKLAVALRLAGQYSEALALIEQALAEDPALVGLNLHRAEILQALLRYEDSLVVYREILARDPGNVPVHHDYNDLLYRLGRKDAYLQSYAVLPENSALQLAKAQFLMHEKRAEEAHDIYRSVLAREPDNNRAASGLAVALDRMGRHHDAVIAFEHLLARAPDNADLHSLAAAAMIRHGDPAEAVALAERGLRAAPDHQACLAVMGTALRVLGDARDEVLNGYDSLIRVFDLEPPDGFSDMASFNAQLCAYLDTVHPDTREHISQTLRGGSQTAYNLFGGPHDLVNRLQHRVDETLQRYLAELKDDSTHPFLKRKRGGFAYAGSWSSRLKDCGFHVNHIHTGWLSSCYYAGVPDAVRDENEKQGWIKFGEPDFESGLQFRRAVQPVAGRLVLFPSYMWHGTIPFHSATPRVTIAFDAVPR